ncbi:MAG: three-Cys-motif partner protein TcmP [Chloroflexi bacterium]|nr:three-Cys-motif partner protein TcmP [Chloroflexota bacterium]
MDDDGLPMRSVGEWTPNKLALISYYLQGFAKLCAGNAGGWYFLDGFAGSGANNAGQLGRFKGSALIGATEKPEASRVVLVERNRRSLQALRRRCERERPDAVVIGGDCNEVIDEALGQFENRKLPAFCVLDPEGMELAWTTVEACATARVKARSSDDDPVLHELLIYFSTPGAYRSGAVTAPGQVEGIEAALRRVFGNDGWRPIAERQRAGTLTGKDAGGEYLALYKAQLEQLGYEYVMSRPSLGVSRGNLIYHLVFATSNEAGRNIMQDALRSAYASQLPLRF